MAGRRPALERQLALTLSAAGEPQEALSVLRPAVEAGDAEALATCSAWSSPTPETRRAPVRRCCAPKHVDVDDPTTQETLALVAIRRGDWAEAKARAERALATDPGLSLAWSYLGGARYNLGEPRRAVEAWERSLAIDPDNFDVLYNLATVARELDMRERARSALERFVREAPRDRYGDDIELARRRLQALLAQP